MKPIHLVEVAAAEPALLEMLAGRLARTFRADCVVRQDKLDAPEALDTARNQYYSTAILQRLEAFAKGNRARVLGVTSVDLYVPVFTYVFGEAQLEGGCAVASWHRLREEFYGLPARPEVLAERLVKEATHELGHTFGLRHCDDWRCVMASSHAVEWLDVKGAEFCGKCGKVVEGG